MSKAPNLLNDDGTASMATALMMSHHAFRRDIAHFAAALQKMVGGDVSRAEAVRGEWQFYRGALHGHHEMEDTRIFPNLRSQQESIGPIVDQLTREHRHIDPLLERGDRAFADLPRTEAAASVVGELAALLEPHLATEEAQVVPFLRAAKEFPQPANDSEADVYAQGFAWSCHGIAPEVLEQVFAMLPGNLTSRLPQARQAFAARCERAWGASAAGAARTPIPVR